MTVYSLNQPVIVQTDKGEVKGRVWSRWSILGEGSFYNILPDDQMSLRSLERNVEAEKVRAA